MVIYVFPCFLKKDPFNKYKFQFFYIYQNIEIYISIKEKIIYLKISFTMPITELHCLDLLDRKKFYNQHNIFYELFKNIFEIDNELFNNTLKLWISNTNFNKSGFKLSPDFIRYAIIVLKMNLFCKIDNKKKTTFCYFNIDNQKKKN